MLRVGVGGGGGRAWGWVVGLGVGDGFWSGVRGWLRGWEGLVSVRRHLL
jgi:hypothetical protein